MIQVDNLHIEQGAFVLEDISFTVPTGGYAVMTGKSGSGKTTILEAVCGLRRLKQGRIQLGDQDVTDLRPAERMIGYAPQDGALFPNYRVGEQLAFAMIVRKLDARSIAERVEEIADLLGIDHLLNRYPDNLSGGEKQRVSLGRILALKPRALCLDEPLSALDTDTHEEICHLLRTTIKQQRITTLHITHNKAEADMLADTAFHLKDGRVEVTTGS